MLIETKLSIQRLVDRSALLGYIEGRLMATSWIETNAVGEFARELLAEIAEREKSLWKEWPLPETEDEG